MSAWLDKFEELERLRNSLDQKKRQLESLDTQIGLRRKHIETIYNSWAWRVSMPFRNVGTFFRQVMNYKEP